MCGILGTINLSFGDVHLRELSHRGPDDHGMAHFDVSKHKVQFGHQRLAILDLSIAGHQPMLSSCGNYAIVFNGEIYNHLDLRKKLPSDIVFRGSSDTETILYYLMEFGIDRVTEFNGIYSIAFLDIKKHKLFLIRDPFGVKPLYYFHEGNSIAFASEIRPIRNIVGKNGVDMEALAVLLRLRYNPAPDTIHETIKKVRPGHYLKVDLEPDEVNVESCHFTRKLPLQVSSSTTSTVYGKKLEAAVSRQLLSDVEVGILLSGGIDSAVVASVAQRDYSSKLKAFTVGFEGAMYEDEIADAAETARFLGLEHHYIRISFNDFLGKLRECTRIIEEPLATTSVIPMFFLCELASKHVKVVLTGQGADEPLGGYFRYKSELLRPYVPAFVRRLASPLAKALNIRNEKITRGANAFGLEDPLVRFLASYEIFSEQEIQKLISIRDAKSLTRLRYFYDLLECKSRSSTAEQMMALDARLNLADDLLNYTDKISMNFSLECRVPMLDIELVEYIESLPVSLKATLRDGKRIHKSYARSILPHEITNRKKRGFQSPTEQWFKNELGTIRDTLLSNTSAFSRHFHQSAVSEILDQHKRGFNRDKQIFLLLTLFFWFEILED